MNRELEALLKAWDQFIQTPKGLEADHTYALYQARLDEVAGLSNVSKDALHRSVYRTRQESYRPCEDLRNLLLFNKLWRKGEDSNLR